MVKVLKTAVSVLGALVLSTSFALAQTTPPTDSGTPKAPSSSHRPVKKGKRPAKKRPATKKKPAAKKPDTTPPPQ